MRLRVVTALGALAVGGGLAATVPAHADNGYQPPQVYSIAPIVHASSGTASVTATYRCFGGQGGGAHLYIAVKQGPKVNAQNHTNSSWATTYYSTNWNYFVDPAGLKPTCDGTVRTDTWILRDDPFWAHTGTAPALRTEAAFVQFCLFDSTSSGQEGDLTGFAFKYQMRGVQAK
jgi:hypothetical protein